MSKIAKISHKALAVLLAMLMMLSCAELSSISALKSLDGFSVYQDGEFVAWWKGKATPDDTEYSRSASVAYIHVTSGDYAGSLAYCIQNRKSGPTGQAYDGYNPWSTYYGANWAEGARAILAYGYPNVNRPFGTLSDIEAYYATTQAFRFWVAENDSAYSYYFSDLSAFSDEELRSYARTGEIPDRLYSFSESGDRALIAAVELLIKARHHEGPTPSYEILTPSISTSLEDTNGNGTPDEGDYYVGYLKVASTNTYRYIINTATLPQGTILTNTDTGYSVSILPGGKTAYNEIATNATVKIEIPLYNPGDHSINDNMHFDSAVAWSGIGAQSQNNIILATPKSEADDLNYQRVVFLGQDEYKIDSKTFSIETGSALPEEGALEITKVDANTGLPMSGVKFTLQLASSYSDPIEKTTNAQGKATWNYIPAGNYTLIETVPSGYKPVDNIAVTISSGVTEKLLIKNVPTVKATPFGRIQIVKRDAETGATAQGNASLAGGIFEIYSNGVNTWYDNGGTSHSYADGELVEKLFSTGSEVISKEIPYGNYIVKEVQAPTGYNINSNSSYIELDAAQTAVVIQDTVVKNTITVNKYMDSLSVPEPNVQFNIYAANITTDAGGHEVVSKGGLVTTMVTNAAGKATSKALPYGRYYVEQATTTSGYNYVDTFIVFINSATETYTYDKINISYKAKLTITKINTDTGLKITSSNACFRIKNQLGNYIESSAGNTSFCTTNGVVETKPLGPGTYNIEEIQAPEGYYKDPNGVNFTISETNGNLDGTAKVNVDFENTPIKGELTIYKIGEMLGTPHDETYADNIYFGGNPHKLTYTAMSLTEDTPLAGATIFVKAAEDIKWPDGSTAYGNGEVVKTFTSKTTPEVISNLPLGKYAISESLAPAGYIKDDEIHYVTLTSQGETVRIVSGNMSINNRMIPTKIVINKDVKRSSGTTEHATAGHFAFGIYTNQAFNINSTNVAKDTLVGILTNGNNDSVKLPAGNYYIKELGLTSAGYNSGKYTRVNLNDSKFEITVDYANAKNNVITINTNNGAAIVNNETTIEKEVTVYKYESNGGVSTPLNGAKLQIKDSTNTVVFTGITQNGEGLKVTLSPGVYTLSEIEAPEGYLINAAEATFTIDQNGEVTGQTAITDTVTSVVLRKTNNLGVGLAGAKFNIYDKDMHFITLSNETDANGNVTISKLMAGEYKFREAVAPTGYMLSDEIFSFTLNGDGSVTGTTSMIDYECVVTIIDLDKETDAKIEGSVFYIYKDDGSGTYPTKVSEGTTNSEGKIEVATLGPGTYKVIQHSVPNGYILNTEPQYITISGNAECVANNLTFKNTLADASIIKTDASDGSPVAGASIRIWNSDSYNQVKVTDASGTISLTGLPIGKYFYQETIAPSGYKLDTTIYEFEILANGTVTGTTSFTNEQTKAVIHKSDITSAAPVPGAQITIYKSDNSVYAEKITDANGDITLEKIPAGTYTYKETLAPNGYILNETIFTFTVSENGTITGETNITNEKNRVVFTKVNDDNEKLEGVQFVLSNAIDGDIGTFTTDADGKLIFSGLTVGVEYTLTETTALDGYELLSAPTTFKVGANGKIIGVISEGITITNVKNKVVIDKKNTLGQKLEGAVINVKAKSGTYNKNFTTNADGNVFISGIPVGTYIIKEITAPDGYKLNNSEYEFSIDAYGHVSGTTTIVDQPIPIVTPNTTDVVLYKKNPDGELLANAKIKVTSTVLLAPITVTTDINGEALLTDLGAGTYTIKELEPPTGYQLNEESYQFTVDNDGNVTGTTTIINTPIPVVTPHVDVVIYKEDTDGNKLAGAKINVKGPGYDETMITDDSGSITALALEPGTYTFKELEPPPGFVLNNTEYTFTVTNTGTVTGTTKIINLREIPKTDVTIYKEDVDGNKLPEAQINIQNADGTYNETKTTDINGEIKLLQLEPGTYTIKEIEAPPGFNLNPDSYTFTISSTGVLSGTTTIVNERIMIRAPQFDLILYKKDNSGNHLSGAKINVIGPSYNTTLISDANGEFNLSGLKAGTYNFKEIEAPVGYKLNTNTYTFTITNEGNITGDTVITNEPLTATVTLYKKSNTNTLLGGATFSVKSKGSAAYDKSFTTDASGKIVIENMAIGTYVLKELEPPIGYTLNNEQYEFTVTNTGEVIGVTTIVNTPIPATPKGNVTIYKEDSDGNKLAGAKIQISGPEYNETLTTDANGSISLYDLNPGTYTIKETEAPTGYKLNKSSYTFVVAADGTVTGTTTIVDEAITATVTLYKESTSGERLGGAKFSVKSKGSTAYSKMFVTDTDGKIVVNNMPIGTYILKEIDPPTGYTLNTAEFEFAVTNTGEVIGTTTIVNTPIPVIKTLNTDVTIYKKSTSNALLPGATISINGKDVAYSYTGTTDSTGAIKLFSLLPGTYIIKETSAPSGYQLNTNSYEFTVDEDGNVTGTTTIIDTPIPVTVTPTTANVTITKVNTDGILLAGAKINVSNKASGYNETFVTGANGQFTINNLAVGTYSIKEVEAPAGYKLNTLSYEFKISSSGVVTGTTTIVNEPVPTIVTETETTHDVTILKVDEEDNPLAGVSFIFYRNGNKLYTRETDEHGLIKLTGLVNGDYTYEELNTLDGYVLSNVIYKFSVTDDGVNGEFKVINYSQKALVQFTKRDASTGNLVPGATMLIKSADGTFEKQIVLDETGELKVEGLKPGVYSLQEISAPDRYAIDPGIYNFEVHDDYSVTGTTDIVDELVKINILKVNENSRPLENAVFGLFEEGSDTASYTVKTDKYGMASFTGVSRGHYILKEIQAPEGYSLTNKEVELIVTDTWINSDNEFTFVDTKINEVPHDTPKTSDESPVLMLTIIIIIAAIGAAFMIILLTKKKKRYYR
jgi:uncharacterized surface anchored protein